MYTHREIKTRRGSRRRTYLTEENLHTDSLRMIASTINLSLRGERAPVVCGPALEGGGEWAAPHVPRDLNPQGQRSPRRRAESGRALRAKVLTKEVLTSERSSEVLTYVERGGTVAHSNQREADRRECGAQSREGRGLSKRLQGCPASRARQWLRSSAAAPRDDVM